MRLITDDEENGVRTHLRFFIKPLPSISLHIPKKIAVFLLIRVSLLNSSEVRVVLLSKFVDNKGCSIALTLVLAIILPRVPSAGEKGAGDDDATSRRKEHRSIS